jgi:hypothetical protein
MIQDYNAGRSLFLSDPKVEFRMNKKNFNKEVYNKYRNRGIPAMGYLYDYNELISRGLVLAIQDDSLVVIEYPLAKRRGLVFDNMSIANFVRRQYKKRFGVEMGF